MSLYRDRILDLKASRVHMTPCYTLGPLKAALPVRVPLWFEAWWQGVAARRQQRRKDREDRRIVSGP